MSKTKIYKNYYLENSIKNKKKVLENLRIKIKNLKEEESVEPEKVTDIMDKLDDVIAGAIEDLGAASEVVSTLVDVAKDVKVQSDFETMSNEEDIEFTEEDEDEKKDEKDEKEDKEIKESLFKPYKSYFRKK